MSEPTKLRSGETPSPPPPVPPSWMDPYRDPPDPMDRWFPRLVSGVMVMVGLFFGGAFLLVLLPRLLIAGHAAWSEALAVWGIR